MKKDVDILVIGAGPAGSVAARHLALFGYEVTMIEKRPVIGLPVRCGEATGRRKRLADFGPIYEDSIETELNGLVLHGAGDSTIRARMPGVGLMLDRLKFDQWYAELAEREGVEVVKNARALDVSPVINGKRCVKVLFEGEEFEIQARMVVGADGAESLSGRWMGLRTRQLPSRTCAAVELQIDQLGPDPDALTFWHGHDFINNGYIWSFPKQKSGVSNFGAGWLVPKVGGPTILEVGQKWLEKIYPDAKILSVGGGAVPVSGVLEEYVADNFLLVGDAAHHTNPLTGGGIASAMCAAQIAAQSIHRAFRDGDFSKQTFKTYERRCWLQFGKNHDREKSIREFILGLEPKSQDEFYVLFKILVEKGLLALLMSRPLSASGVAWKFLRQKGWVF